VRVAIIGAGVIGSSIALAMGRAGHEVTVIDRNSAVGMGSTSSSSAVVRFNYSTFDAVALAWESFHYWKSWREFLGIELDHYAELANVGVAMLDVPVISESNTLELFDQVGIPHEKWDSKRLKDKIPGIDAGKYWPPKPVKSDEFWSESDEELGCIYTPDGGYISDPLLATENLAAAARASGVTFLLGREIVGIRTRESAKEIRAVSGVEIEGVGNTAGREFLEFDVVVNVAGPWSGQINELAGVGGDFTLSVKPMRQEVHQISTPKNLLSGPIVGDLDLGIYARSGGGGVTIFGGTEPECDPLQWVENMDEVNMSRTVEVFESQSLRLARRFPAAQIPSTPVGIVGVYDVSSDWTPIYDRSEVDGFYLAIGTSGNQFKNAPCIGLIMQKLIEAIEAGADHDLEPVKYQCLMSGHEINLGAFSRKRERNEKSSGTVMG
jgi:sarcosine oxidase subunit beta